MVAVYVVIFALLSAGIYYSFIKAPETCFDGKQNQNEQGVDCGGACGACREVVIGQDLEIKEAAFVSGGNGRFDVVAKIYNPNDEAGASSFRYTFELKDASGKVMATRSGESYILPQENKYVMELNLETATEPNSVEIKTENIRWEHFSGYQEKPAVNVYQRRYNQISSGVGFSEAYGLLSNESLYDFRSIVVKVILRDNNGKPLAFNQTEMRTVVSHENRDFRLVWPTAFPGTVERIDMEVDADIYHTDNFIRQYLPSGQFQQLTPPQAY